MKHKLITLLVTALWILLPYGIQAQEDSPRMGRKTVGMDPITELLWKQPGQVKLDPTLPTVPPQLPATHFRLPKLPTIPYYTHPAPLYKGDYSTQGTLLPHRYGALQAAGSQSSVPGIGRFNQASLIYVHRLNDKLSFQLSMDAMKVNMSHLSGQAFSTSGMMRYQATDKLGFRVFGSYAPGPTYGMTTHSYGGTLMWQVSDRFGLEMGVQRYYDSMRGGWQTVPVVIPSYRFDHFKLELDVGGLLYEILRSTVFDHANDSRGPTIAPPKFSYPIK